MASLVVLLLAAVSLDGGPGVDAGVTNRNTFDAGDPSTWRLSAKLGEGALREALISSLTSGWRADGGVGSGVGVGETPLTKAEAEALLGDPRAELIYGDKTVSIVAPSMVKRHRQEHIDLMARFLQPERVAAGLKFRDEKQAVLSATEQRTGVDREVIIGILMWESKLGTITGDYLAFNALASQAFFVDEANAVALAREEEKALLAPAAKKDKQAKAPTVAERANTASGKVATEQVQANRVERIRERARRNLVVLVRQCKTRSIDALTVKGSWAGAIGFPQFMPASLRWAEDGNGDGKIDLFEMDDAIASVGRYLASAGFKKSRRDAVYDYNHEEAYVQGVLAFADALKAGGVDAGVVAPAGR